MCLASASVTITATCGILQLALSFSLAFYFLSFYSHRVNKTSAYDWIFGWRSDKQRSSSVFVFSPFYNSTDNMVQDGWQVGRDTLQHSWEQCWASVLHLVFCQNNSDSMLMLVRRRVPILYPVLRFSTRADAICSFLPQPHVPFPFSFALKGPSVNEGKINRFFLGFLLLMCFCVQKPAQLGKEQS